MNLLRSTAFFALAAATPLGLRADAIPAGAVAPTVSGSSANSPSLYAITRGVTLTRASDPMPVATGTSMFGSAPIPVGDPVQSLRPFAIRGETIETGSVEAVSDTAAPTPEPAGLFLLGTGAFATALTIRYRLFSL